MKKAKIMLMMITIMAIIGGSLAFKAKKYLNTYCATLAISSQSPFSCPTRVSGTSVDATVFYYTTTFIPGCADLACLRTSIKLGPEN